MVDHSSAQAQLEHSIGRHEIGFCGVGGDVVKCFYGADPLRCVEMVTSNFAVKSTLISLLLLNRQNLFPVSNNSCPMCASIHVASKRMYIVVCSEVECVVVLCKSKSASQCSCQFWITGKYW